MKNQITQIIELELKTVDDTGKEESEKIQVLLKETSKFTTADILADNLNKGRNGIRSGQFIKDCMEVVIVSPKDLIEKIEKAENGLEVMGHLSVEIQNFLGNPRLYKLKKQEELQAKSNEESSAVGESTEQPDTDGSQESNS